MYTYKYTVLHYVYSICICTVLYVQYVCTVYAVIPVSSNVIAGTLQTTELEREVFQHEC